MKNIIILIACVFAFNSYSSGKLQDADFKTEADLIGLGGTASLLLNDTKIYVTSVAKTLDDAIADGDIAGAPTTTKGDLSGHNGTDPTRFPVGNDGEFIIADSSESLGVKWSDQLQGKLNPVTDWETFTPTFTNVTLGTGSYSTAEYRYVGDSIEIQYALTLGTGGSVGGAIKADLPSGVVADFDKLISVGSSSTGYPLVGNTYSINGSTSYSGTVLIEGQSNKIVFYNHASGNQYNATTPFTWGAGDQLMGLIRVPVVGKTSGLNAVVQNKKLYQVEARQTVNQTITSSTQTTVIYNNEVKDDYNIYNSTTGVTTIPSDGAGFYSIDANVWFVTGVTNIVTFQTIWVNGTQRKSGLVYVNSADRPNASISHSIYLNAGDTVEVKAFHTAAPNRQTEASGAAFNNFSIVQQPESFVLSGTFGKCQTKYLSANITTDTTDISDLRFNNLTIGSRYRVKVRPDFFVTSADSEVGLVAAHNGVGLAKVVQMNQGSSGGNTTVSDRSAPFTATASTVTFNTFSMSPGTFLRGSGDYNNTWVELCTSNEADTTEWN